MPEFLTLPGLLAQTREVSHLFDQLVGPWTPAVMMSELAAEVGTLADSIMITEGHRPPRPEAVPLDLADDVADVLFMLLRIADYYSIDLHEAYISMLTSTRECLEQQLEGQEVVLIKPLSRENIGRNIKEEGHQ
jgi:NTP pyrophosphatase (non-canonical NTP hydrolase)